MEPEIILRSKTEVQHTPEHDRQSGQLTNVCYVTFYLSFVLRLLTHCNNIQKYMHTYIHTVQYSNNIHMHSLTDSHIEANGMRRENAIS